MKNTKEYDIRDVKKDPIRYHSVIALLNLRFTLFLVSFSPSLYYVYLSIVNFMKLPMMTTQPNIDKQLGTALFYLGIAILLMVIIPLIVYDLFTFLAHHEKDKIDYWKGKYEQRITKRSKNEL